MLKVKKEDLIQGFSIVDRVIKLTPTMPILSNIFVSKEKDKGVFFLSMVTEEKYLSSKFIALPTLPILFS